MPITHAPHSWQPQHLIMNGSMMQMMSSQLDPMPNWHWFPKPSITDNVWGSADTKWLVQGRCTISSSWECGTCEGIRIHNGGVGSSLCSVTCQLYLTLLNHWNGVNLSLNWLRAIDAQKWFGIGFKLTPNWFKWFLVVSVSVWIILCQTKPFGFWFGGNGLKPNQTKLPQHY